MTAWKTLVQHLQRNPHKKKSLESFVLPSCSFDMFLSEEEEEYEVHNVREEIHEEIEEENEIQEDVLSMDDIVSSCDTSVGVHDESLWCENYLMVKRPIVAVLTYLQHSIDNVPITSCNEATICAFLRKYCTEMQTNELSKVHGRKFPKTKTNEAFVSACMEDKQKWEDLSWSVLSALYEIQILVLDAHKKTLLMFPQDFSTWSEEKRVLVVDSTSSILYSTPKQFTWKENIVEYLLEKESEEYIIPYGKIDEKVDILKELYKEYTGEDCGKMLKPDLMVAVARAKAHYYLGQWKKKQ